MGCSVDHCFLAIRPCMLALGSIWIVLIGLADAGRMVSHLGVDKFTLSAALAIVCAHLCLAWLLHRPLLALLGPELCKLRQALIGGWGAKRTPAAFGRSLGWTLGAASAVLSLAAAVAAVTRLDEAFATPAFVAAAQALSVVVCCLVGAGLARRVYQLSWRVLIPIPLRPMDLGVTVAFATLAGYAYLWEHRDLLFKEIDPFLVALVLAHLLGAVLAPVAIRFLVVFIAALTVGGLGAWAPATPGMRPPDAAVGEVLYALANATDFDRDDVPIWLGGGDCDPFDPAIFPGALDLPGDGIDQDCRGGDAAPIGAPIEIEVPEWAMIPQSERSELVVLVSIDALRADVLSSYGYEAHLTSPGIDRWAARAAIFDRAFSNAAYTRAAISGLVTGRSISEITSRMGDLKAFAIPPDLPTLGQRMKSSGFKTHAITTGLELVRRRRGFDRGFATREEISNQHIDSAEQTVEAARRWLADNPTGKRFLWLHFFDPHSPYEAHPEFDFGTRDRERYAASVAHLDRHLAPLLESISLHPKSTVVLTADHGEAFGEHGRHKHGHDLHVESVAIPLLIRGIGVQPGVVRMPVSLLDVMPTILHLGGASALPTDGQSLVPQLHGIDRDLDRTVFSERDLGEQIIAATTLDHRLIFDLRLNRLRLFDSNRDPQEQTDIKEQSPEAFDRLNEALNKYLAGGPRRRAVQQAQKMLVSTVPATARLETPHIFGEKVALVGARLWYETVPRERLPQARLSLYWRAKTRLKRSWKLVVGLRQKGRRPVHVSRYPGGGDFAIDQWPIGSLVEEVVPLGGSDRVAQSAKSDVTIGWYIGGERLLPAAGPLARNKSKTRVVLKGLLSK
jgi:arylsulfatase A-like enzyme